MRSSFILLGCLIVCSCSAPAQVRSNSDSLFSPSTALECYEIAHELATPNGPDSSVEHAAAEQALVFLNAALELDSQATYVWPDMIKLACRATSPLHLALEYARPAEVNEPNAPPVQPQDNSELVKALLLGYVRRTSNLEIAQEAIRYLLARMDSREQKEQQLSELLTALRGRNSLLESELAASLGVLFVEKSDFDGAQAQFIAALDKNPYNRLASTKLYELAGENVTPAWYLEQLKYHVSENPLDLEAAIAFAGYAQQLEMFELATDAFEHCAELFEYLYPDQPLPRYIYLPWALSTFNSGRSPYLTIRIAKKMQDSGVHDLMLQAVAAEAARKTEDTEQAEQILQTAEQQATSEYASAKTGRQRLAEDLAWFYCFAKQEPDQAIDWANKAYAAEPNSPTAAALLAYALVLNQKTEWAKPFLDAYEPNPVLSLTKAKVELADSNNTAATETLKALIAAAPESIEAYHARQMLTEAGSEYIPAVDAGVVSQVLENSFGANLVPQFLPPNQILSVSLRTRGEKFSYGSDFGASLVITNKSSEPLVISPYGLLQGNLRVDAFVRGDINRSIPKVVSMRFQPSSPIAPDASLIVPLKLRTGPFKQLLLTHPQASLEIEFTAYLDPVQLEDGTVANRLEDLAPVTQTVSRPATEITAQFLRNRMNTLKRRRQSARTAQLFAGLLKEQYAMAGREPLYRLTYADWMPEILKSSLVYCLDADDWIVRVDTMAAMTSLPLDFALIEGISNDLNNEHWPVRMMALYLLAKNQDQSFMPVLDHIAKYDQHKLVRDMAVALGGKAPENL